MAHVNEFYRTNAQRQITQGGATLPIISEGLDSVRAYQFEIHFKLPATGNTAVEEDLTLAAKQVTAVGMAVADIEVHRVNDKVFYPGKATPEELTVTFDSLYNKKVATQLWSWFSSIYDPMNGQFNPTGSKWKAQSATILQLNAHGVPIMETNVYGVYPRSWKTAEFNYATSEFHTIEVIFRYDFMEQANTGN